MGRTAVLRELRQTGSPGLPVAPKDEVQPAKRVTPRQCTPSSEPGMASRSSRDLIDLGAPSPTEVQKKRRLSASGEVDQIF